MQAFKAANNGMRPNFMAVGGYDGMHLIYEGLKKTNGAGGEVLMRAGTYSIPGAHKDSFMRMTNAVNF